MCNFAEKNIAGVVSQVLILGSIDKDGKVILVHPSQKSENGLPIAWICILRYYQSLYFGLWPHILQDQIM